MEQIIIPSAFALVASAVGAYLGFLLAKNHEKINEKRVYVNLLKALKQEFENNRECITNCNTESSINFRKESAPISMEVFKTFQSNKNIYNYISEKLMQDIMETVNKLCRFKACDYNNDNVKTEDVDKQIESIEVEIVRAEKAK